MAHSIEETLAAAIVVSVLDAECFVPRDLGRDGGRASHDFDLRFGGDRPEEPLEVTTAAKSGVLATKDRVRRGGTLPAPGSLVWSLVPRTSFPDGVDSRTGKMKTKPHPIEQVHSRVMEHLRVLEAAGVMEFPSLDVPSPEAARASFVLTYRCGLLCGRSRPPGPDEDPHVSYAHSSGGAGDPARLEAALIAEAQEPGNVAKLRTDAERRHLFVHVDPSSGDAYVAARHAALPAQLSGLPPEITTLWLWAADRHVFSITPPATWQKHGITDEVLRDPAALECAELRG